jgi:tetratricopeptide (TPR) repeat protein
MAKVFISYSHQDREWVENWLMPRLEEAGLEVCIDFRDFEVGIPSLVNMERAVDTCNKTLLILTTKWIESQWTNFEALMIQAEDPAGLKGRILPLMLEKCEPPKRLSIFTYADFTDKNKWDIELDRLLKQMGATGPVRKTNKDSGKQKISLSKLPTTGTDFFGRKKQLKELDQAWEDAHTHIVTLIAWGGVGKSALVNRWLNMMQGSNYCNARNVYGWSFYSQGAEEGKHASADEFMQEILTWFGDPDPGEGSAMEKGRRLANLVRQEPALLIMDGLEPLQYPPGEVHGFDGGLKDQGLKTFLKELAGGGEQQGLCVITSREPVTDLGHKQGFTVKEMELERLSTETGNQLLKKLGVNGAQKEINKAVEEYDGHALALTLLGKYIKKVHDGDIRKRDRIPELTKERSQGRHARRVMAAYERWLGESPELNILRMMGLFDRPVKMGAVDALKAEPAIPGVTDKLREIAEDDWQFALDNLRTASLLAKKDPQKPDVLDCHPLIREHFGEKLRNENPEGWKAAHKRLYHYYKDLPEKELPDTLEEMEPLFAAVAHGCSAGLHQEALDDVYWERILRRDDFFCTSKLGAFGADLAALANFFEKPWTHPAAALTDEDKALILGLASFRLRFLGRLQEAINPMEMALEKNISQENWKEASKSTGNLSELMLALGKVDVAVSFAQQSVTNADRSWDLDEKVMFRSTLANAFHQSGNLKEAEKWFRESEALQKKREPECTFLYSARGYQYCDLLLSQGKYREVMERAQFAIEISKKNKHLLSIALDNLSIGRAWMMKALEEDSSDLNRALDYFNLAVTGLREASAHEFLVICLLIRAECYRHMKEFSRARADLNEAEEIAELGGMKLYLCDVHLEAGRLSEAEGKTEEAEEHFRVAKEMIEETGYFRRKNEVGSWQVGRE